MKKNKYKDLVFMLEEDNKVMDWLILPLVMVLMELFAYFYLFGFKISISLLFSVISAVALGLFLDIICSFFSRKIQRWILTIIVLLLAIVYCVDLIYYSVFHLFFLWQTIGLAADAVQFYREAINAIINNWYVVAYMLVMIFIVNRYLKNRRINCKLPLKVVSAILAILLVGFVYYDMNFVNKRIVSHLSDDTSAVYNRYGVLNSSFIDMKEIIFGKDDNQQIDNYVSFDVAGKTNITLSMDKLVEKNMLYIDFDKMIENTKDESIVAMHKYFQSKTATEKNEYTGLFEGKNLIFLTLEGFCDQFIDEQLTPTLYKMANEGFVFNNFYDPSWGGSTATGEYCNMTGNFYYSASCLSDSANTLTYSALGNLFKNNGYDTYAYHNHTYDYYDRDLSHPNFGYQIYKGVGNGLNLKYTCWPNSDYEMMVSSINDYINDDEPFHVYYMTVSGHLYYTYNGNNMASLHYDDVKDLDYSDEVKPYIATQMEVEKALTYLVEKLDEAGKLDDTVFAMCCDHYPYGLSDSALAELYGLEENDIRANFELYRNGFILYNSAMENPIVIDDCCGPYDIVPTLANLFGVEYDSRFITGSDILASNCEHFTIINTMTSSGGNYNWISSEGTYYSVSDSFVKSENCQKTEEEIAEYVKLMNSKIELMKNNSFAILEKNYYSYVFNKDGSVKYPLE